MAIQRPLTVRVPDSCDTPITSPSSVLASPLTSANRVSKTATEIIPLTSPSALRSEELLSPISGISSASVAAREDNHLGPPRIARERIVPPPSPTGEQMIEISQRELLKLREDSFQFRRLQYQYRKLEANSLLRSKRYFNQKHQLQLEKNNVEFLERTIKRQTEEIEKLRSNFTDIQMMYGKAIKEIGELRKYMEEKKEHAKAAPVLRRAIRRMPSNVEPLLPRNH